MTKEKLNEVRRAVREQREEYLEMKLNEIRVAMRDAFEELGMLHIAIDHDYINVFSSSHTEDNPNGVNLSKFYYGETEN